MINNLHNIVVYIKDEAMLQEAREILERYNQPISSGLFFTFGNNNEYLLYDDETPDWMTYFETEGRKEITLPELEQKLKEKHGADILSPKDKAKELESYYANLFSVDSTKANLMAQNDINTRIMTYIEVERDVMPKDGVTFSKWHDKVTYYNNVLTELLS